MFLVSGVLPATASPSVYVAFCSPWLDAIWVPALNGLLGLASAFDHPQAG